MRNVVLAFRTLFRTPFITAVAALSIALGIGANAAIFSLFEQMLLRSLPVPQPERLVNLGAPGPKPGATMCGPAGDCDVVFSYPMFRDLEHARTGFSGIAAHRWFPANLSIRGENSSAEGLLVSGSYFPVLGLTPALGRLISPEDDGGVGGHPVAVLSHAYWETALGSDPDVVGTAIRVNGEPLTVVGVAPPGFEGTTLGTRPLVFVPITMTTRVLPWLDAFEDRQSYWTYLFGRLRPGGTIEQAAEQINAVYRPILVDVEAPLQAGMSDETMRQFRAKEVALADGARGQSTLHGEVREPLVLLFSVAGVVLLIACANIANLLLARGTGRRLEMAVRLSLGASRSQVVVQLLTESLVLGVLGGVAGLLVAHWTLGGIASLLPEQSAAMLQLGLREPVILFAALLALGTGLLFGLVPALQSTRPDLISAIRGNTGQIAGSRSAARLRTGLVVAQLALSTALLTSAGLFIKSLVNVSRVDLGMRADQVVTFAVAPGINGIPPERSRLLLERLEEELAALPGVSGVTAAATPILRGITNGSDVSVEGFAKGPDTDDDARLNRVGPGWFRTMGTPLLAGREFSPADRVGAPKVAIVNEAFARKFGLGPEAVGRRMAFGDGELDVEIVGLARDAKLGGVKDDAPPTVVTPYRQDEVVVGLYYYVRTAGDPAQLLREVPGVVASLDPNLPVQDLKTLPQQVKENVFLNRMISTLSAAFATLATVLAAVGLYGVLAYTVAQRTREIGVRMALGADARRVRRLVLGQVGRMIVVGCGLGVAAALALGRAAGSLLFGLEGTDPLIISAATAVLALAAFSAGYLPARRASRVDPMQALRYD